MEYLTLGHPPFQGLATHQLGELFGNLPTPAYVIDQARLEQNGQVLSALAQRTGCHILLAQKAFSNYDFYPLLSQYLAGTEASGLYEARLGFEEMGGKEVHVFCAGYREDEFGELLRYADHIVFNSIHQLKTLGPRAKEAGKRVGLRINPQCSTQEGHAIYDPCAPGSRMGVTREVWNAQMDALIETVSQNAQVDVPRPMVERQIDAMINDMSMRMSYQGLRMEDFLKYTGQTMEDLRKQYDAQAASRVRAELVLDAVRVAENIQATDEDVENEILKYAKESERSAEELKETLSEQDKEYFKDMVVSQKVIDLLMEKAVEVEKKSEEEPAKAE